MNSMQSQININIAVDVIKALSEQSLYDNIYMMDDSRYGSTRQGTAHLCTACLPGQTIQWTIYPIDLQTPASIKSISFLSEEGWLENAKNVSLGNPDLKVWKGIVPSLAYNRRYAYRLEVQMGEGKNSCLYIDTPSLVYATSFQAKKQ